VTKNRDSWFIKQPESGERVSDMSGSSSTEEGHGLLAVKSK
jgi:hypothetical protein